MPQMKLLRLLRGNDNIKSKKRELMPGTNAALRWLAQKFPVAFPDDTKQIDPLAIGSRDQVLEAIETGPNAPEAGIVQRSQGLWTKSGPYVTAAAQGCIAHRDGSRDLAGLEPAPPARTGAQGSRPVPDCSPTPGA